MEPGQMTSTSTSYISSFKHVEQDGDNLA